jgi:hypothetical protein
MRTLVGLASVIVLAAGCNEGVIADLNAPTQYPKTYSGLQSAFTGAAGASIRGDIATYALDVASLSREAAYFTASEPRFITELTGEQPLQTDNFGAAVWNNIFATIKGIDTTQTALPVLTNGQTLSADTVATLWAQLETFKALDYMYLAETRDTAGVPINAVGGPTSATAVAPILCLPTVWAQIVAQLDSAVAKLNGVPATTPLISGLLPSGFNLVNDNARDWLDLTLALRGKARIEYAYALARGASGAGTAAPNQAQLDSALSDLGVVASHGILYSDAALNPLGAVGADPGVYLQFSTASGDLADPLGQEAPGYFALLGAVAQIDTLHDQRFLVKFGRGTLPTTAYDGGAVPANLLGSDWQYGAGTEPDAFGLGGVLPIVRNVQLHLLTAEAEIGLGEYAQAIGLINTVRVNAGGLAAETVSPDFQHARDFLLQELLVSLLSETGDHLIAIRNYGLTTDVLTTWAPYGGDLHTAALPIPLAESSSRNGNIAPVCAGP